MSAATEYFEELTGVDISQFFTDYITFIDTYFQSIVDYYNGSDINSDAFNFYDQLVADSIKVENAFDNNLKRFPNTDYWELIDKFGDVQIKLDSVANLSKWQRSSRLNRYDSSVSVEYIQKQNETLEVISKKSGSVSPENDWEQLAIQNDIIEEDYTSEGGVLLDITFNNNANFNLRNIVDSLGGENVKGKDLFTKFEFENGDLKIVTGDDAIEQTFETILNTVKGSIPEFPEDGINSSVIGSNVRFIQYPSIFRGLTQMFQKDDRFSSISLLNVERVGDNVFMKIQVKTKVGDLFNRSLRL